MAFRVALVALVALVSACASAPKPSPTATIPDRATRIRLGVLSPVDVDEAITEPCDGDPQVMMRGLSYYYVTRSDAYPRHGELTDRIAACAEERVSAGAARAALELTRGGLTFEPNSDALHLAHEHVRERFAAPLFARAEDERRTGAAAAELFDLSLGLFVWPEQPGASARMSLLADALEAASAFHVRLEVRKEPNAATFGEAALGEAIDRAVQRRLVRLDLAKGRDDASAARLRLTVELGSYAPSRKVDGCPIASLGVRVGGISVQGERRVEIPPTYRVFMTPSEPCVSPNATPAELRQALVAQLADALASTVRSAYDLYRMGLFESADAHAKAGEVELALEPYVLFQLHQDGAPAGQERGPIVGGFLRARELDAATLAKIDGFSDRFRAVPLRGVKAPTVIAEPR